MTDEPLEVADTAGLSDADWAEINKLKLIYQCDGKAGLSKAIADLVSGDPVRAVRVIGV